MTSLTGARVPRPAEEWASFKLWFRALPSAWRTPGPLRRFAVLAMIGALTDALTTSLIGTVPGIMEQNPLAAHGQEVLGSVPLFMLLVTIPVLLTLSLLAAKPAPDVRVVWYAVIFLALVKISVSVWNITVIIYALGKGL